MLRKLKRTTGPQRAEAEQLSPAAAATNSNGPINTNNLQAIQAFTEPIKTPVLTAFTYALDDVFLVDVPVVALALVTHCS